MQRRHLLRTLAAGLAAPAVLVHARSTSRLRVGVSLPITSVQAAVATDLRLGITLAADQARERGLPLEIEIEDDRSEPDRTAAAIERFGKDMSFVATTSLVGTPHALKAAPLARRHELPIVGLRSGAAELRDGGPGIYHLRAGFNDEITRMLRFVREAGLTRVAVVYSDDAFGRSAMTHARARAGAHGVEIAVAEAAERNGSNIEKVVDYALRQSPERAVGALMLLMITEPMQRGLLHARSMMRFANPVFAMSFCGTRNLAESRAPHLDGLGLMSSVPLPRVDPSPLAQAYVRLAKAVQPGLENSLTGFEGFFYASTLTAALERAPSPTRTGLREALRAPLEVGGYRVAFDERLVGYGRLGTLHKSREGGLRA